MNHDALRDLITATPQNEGESSADYAARVVSLCDADARTVTAIPLGDATGLRKYLSSLGLRSRLERTVADADFAPFVTAATGGNPATVADQVLDALSWIFDGNNATLDTTDPTIAAQTDALLALMVAFNGTHAGLGLTQAEADGFVSRGGGYLLRGATADDVTAEVTGMASDADKDRQRKAAADGYNAAMAAIDAPGTVTDDQVRALLTGGF